MLQRPSILLAFVLVLTGCNRGVDVQRWSRERHTVGQDYYSDDIFVAESALVSLIALEQEGQKRGYTKDDLDWTMGLAYGRLHLIHVKLNRPVDAEMHMAKAIYHMDKSAQFRGQPVSPDTAAKRRSLLDGIERLDANREIKWKAARASAPHAVETAIKTR